MNIQAFGGCAAWHGRDIAGSGRWVRRLSASQVDEIEAALRTAQARGAGWREVRREDFPLPTVSGLLAEVADELENGTGLFKLRGLPVERFGPEELRLLWMGLGRHLGTPRYQNARGMLMRDIRDEGAGVGERYGQLRQADGGTFLSSYARTLSRGDLRYHTDRTDVVGLLCVNQAKTGGMSKVASTLTIHNLMLERRPDLVELLYRPIYRSRLGEERGGKYSVYALPVFGVRDGVFTSHYSRTYIEAAQLLPGVPRMSAAQWEALDMLAAVADEVVYEMRLERGDIQLLNNHVIYHSRTAFTDDPEAGYVRILYRLWLSMPNSRALPEDQSVLWRDVAAGAVRGGIGQEAMGC